MQIQNQIEKFRFHLSEARDANAVRHSQKTLASRTATGKGNERRMLVFIRQECILTFYWLFPVSRTHGTDYRPPIIFSHLEAEECKVINTHLSSRYFAPQQMWHIENYET